MAKNMNGFRGWSVHQLLEIANIVPAIRFQKN